MYALKLHATIDSRRRLQLDLPADTPEGVAEVIVLMNERKGNRSSQASDPPPEESLEQLFAAIDAMPRRRLSTEEIDQYLAQERASWE